MRNALIIISGISYDDYGLRDVSASPIYESLRKRYHTIVEFRYQHLMDLFTPPDPISRVYLDPVKLKLSLIRRNVILNKFKKLVAELDRPIDVLAHSLGCWITALADVEIDNAYFCGSPIGWFAPLGRFLVRNDISFFPNSKPPLKVKGTFFNLYSNKDKVGNVPSVKDNDKWAFGASLFYELNTGTKHDFSEYLKVMHERGML